MGCQGMKEQHRTRWEEEEADCAPSSSRCPQPDDIPDHTDISDESEYESADEFDDYMDDSCWRIQSAEEDRAAHRLWARLSQKDCIQTADFDFWLGYRRNAGFLHSCLRASSMSLDKAYDIAKRFAQLRADANWPLRLSAHHVKNTLHTGMHWLLRGRDNVGRAVVVYNAAKLDLQHAPVGDYQQMGSFLMETAMLSHSTQTDGVMLIADLRGMEFKMFSPADMKRGVRMWAGAFPCKLKRIVVISPGGMVHMILNMALGLLDEKIRNRVVVISADEIDSIADEVSVDVLPTSLGGSVNMDTEWPLIVDEMHKTDL